MAWWGGVLVDVKTQKLFVGWWDGTIAGTRSSSGGGPQLEL